MNPAVAFAGGFIIASALWIVFSSVKWNDLYKDWKDSDEEKRELQEEVEHLKQLLKPFDFRQVDGAVDGTVYRGRPDIKVRDSGVTHEAYTIDVDDDIPPMPFEDNDDSSN